MPNILRDRTGLALILVVTVISLLIAVTTQFARDTREELAASVSMRNFAAINAALSSGYNIAAAVLKKDAAKSSATTLLDDWAELKGADLQQFYSDLGLDVVVTDLSGRIQLNALAYGGKTASATKIALRKLLLSGDLGELEEEQADLIIAAIIDWIDKDGENSASFAETESGYYATLDPPYACKNDELERPEELLLIRGITKSLYYGTSSRPGLRDLVTVYNDDGLININTAPKAVLRALGSDETEEIDAGTIEKMLAFRAAEENASALGVVSWYKSVPEWPGDVTLQSKLVAVTSSYFRILSHAELDGMIKDMTSVVQRRKGSGTLQLIDRMVE